MDDSIKNIIWGTFGSLISAGLILILTEWFRWFSNRPLLKVSLTIKHSTPHMSIDQFKVKLGIPLDQELNLEPGDTNTILIKAINPHPKKITAEKLGFTYKSKKLDEFTFMRPEDYKFSHEIEENKAITITMLKVDLFAPLYAAGRRPLDLKRVWIETSTGQIFSNKIDRKTILELDRWYHREWEGHTK